MIFKQIDFIRTKVRKGHYVASVLANECFSKLRMFLAHFDFLILRQGIMRMLILAITSTVIQHFNGNDHQKSN
jgi:hypothetical protein